MPVAVSAILAKLKPSGLLLELRGADATVSRIAAAEDGGPGDLVIVDSPDYAALALQKRPSAVVARPDLADSLSPLTVLTAANVRLAHATIAREWFDRDLRNEGWPRIHPSAVVHESASVASTAVVGPGAVIGARAAVGERAAVLAGAVVEHDAVLGDDTVVHPNAVVGHGCRIGRRCIVKAGAVIGSEGFGFAQDGAKRNHRIPQVGRVVLEDGVVVGANCCIDRAAFRETRIGAGTVMDNLCHVAHNVRVGEDCILTAMFCVAGSSTLGRRVAASGMTGVVDHVTIADDVTLLQRAGVGQDIPKPGPYAGNPAEPLDQYLKNTAAARRLADLRDEVKGLGRRLAALEAGR